MLLGGGGLMRRIPQCCIGRKSLYKFCSLISIASPYQDSYRLASSRPDSVTLTVHLHNFTFSRIGVYFQFMDTSNDLVFLFSEDKVLVTLYMPQSKTS